MRVFACLQVLLLLVNATSVSAAEPSPKPTPNFVVIFIDDMGYGDIGPFGSRLNRTPQLDRMASEGMKLTSFYAAPVCSASRAQLLTGCYAPRVSVPGVFFPAGPRGLHPDEQTVADHLHRLGYATVCIGKWHLGDQRVFLPTRQGFDGYFGIPYSNDMGRPTLEDGRSVHPLMRDEKVAELLENEGQRRITRAYTEEAVRFITRNRDRRFFLYLPHTAMHVPLFPHKDFAGKSKNGTYGDWVEEVDWSVGRVLETLRSLQLDRNTLVLFTSDNGPWASKGKAGGVAGPLRGSKGCTLEGGVRVPTIAWWPGTVRPGTSHDGIAGTTDVLPTLVGLAGGDLARAKGKRRIDGIDISPMLTGQSKTSPRDHWFYYQGTRLKAVRSGPWKLAVMKQSLGMGIRQKPADLNIDGPRLYNLDKEIGEKTNRAQEHPEVVARLQKLVASMRADIGSGRPGPGVRPAGQVKNPVTLFPSRPRRRTPTRAGKPIAWQTAKPGDAYPSGSAPRIAGKAFHVDVIVEPRGSDGVLIAHGGSAVGYSLYIKNQKLTWAVRYGTNSIQRLTTNLPDKPNSRLRASVSPNGLELRVNERKPVVVKRFGVLGRHPQEGLCIGHDNANPVDNQSTRKRFGGKLSGLKVTVGDRLKTSKPDN